MAEPPAVRRASGPADRRSSPSNSGGSHLLAERHDTEARYRLLARLVRCFDQGMRDPELLYLGGRYAVSLGLPKVACRFLEPLSKLLHGDQGPSPAFFPVGLLYCLVLPPGQERDKVIGDLHALAGGSARLARVLQRAGCDPNGRLPAGSPQRFLEMAEGDMEAVLQEDLQWWKGEHNGTCGRLRGLAEDATRGYRAGDLARSRIALENLLLHDGDQPDVLRNLVVVTSEQQDAEAYCRYWRRYVKLLLWRVMRNDGAAAAYDDMVHFYTAVARVTDREFGHSGQKAVERLRTPGLLPRWLEAHAALIWLEEVLRSHRGQRVGPAAGGHNGGRLGRLAVMKLWFRAFYPEFSGYVDVASAAAADGDPHRQVKATALPFDPAWRLLQRFAEWAKLQFALENDHDEHAETVTALSGFAARIPWEPYVSKLYGILRDNNVGVPFRRAMQDACSLALRFRLGRFLNAQDGQKEDWAGLIAFYGDPDLDRGLSPDLRLFLAFGLCRENQAWRGLDIACQTLPEMQPDDLKEDSQNRALFKNVVHAALHEIMQGEPPAQRGAFERLVETLDRAGTEGPVEAFRQECLDDVRQAREAMGLRKRVDEAIEQSKTLVEQGQFGKARQVISGLPDSPSDLKELKRSLLRQIGEAEEQAGLHARIESAIEKSKRLVGQSKFREAKDVIRALPDSPSDLKELKRDLLRQIGEAEEQAGLHARIESAIEKSKRLVGQARFRQAKDVIRALPDSPADLRELKQNLLGQIAEVERRFGGR